jgi:hypothetical protein
MRARWPTRSSCTTLTQALTLPLPALPQPLTTYPNPDPNQVLVYDSLHFPFHLGEPYHQFHSNFFQSAGMVGGSYPASYTTDLWAVQKDIGELPSTGCRDGRHY